MIILDKILSMTINGSVLILLILLFRKFLANRMTREIILMLWEGACLVLIFPITVSIPQPVANPIKETVLIRQVINQPIQLVKTHTQAAVSQPVLKTAITSNHLLLGLYLLGLIIFGLLILIGYYRSQKIAKQALPIGGLRIGNLEKKYKKQLFRSLKIQQSDRIYSPMTSGILSPKILLPSDFEYSDEESILLVLTHEMVHIQRWDNLRKICLLFVLWLHWFNPLVWLMYYFYSCDLEIVCDKVTLAKLGNNFKKKYAHTLIKWNRSEAKMMRVHPHFSKNPIKERIEILLKKNKRSILLNIASIIVVGGTGVMLITKYASASSLANQKNDTTQSSTVSSAGNNATEPSKEEQRQEGQPNNSVEKIGDYNFSYLEKYQEMQDKASEEEGLPPGLYYEAPTTTMVENHNSSHDEVQAEADSYGLLFEPGPYYVNRRKAELSLEEITLFEQMKGGAAYLESEEWLLVEHPDYTNKLEQHRVIYSDGTTLKTSFVYDLNLDSIVMITNEDYTYGQGHGIELKAAVNDNLEFIYEIERTRYGQ
ncbi:M56 family metallopeptidase [Enterococcus sp. LJL51]|uniref:M56 family metallopeptidase n=1 Tax=Enterococcus sp. LJL51 TaxID=3416656 RepID=UPI003CF1D3E3